MTLRQRSDRNDYSTLSDLEKAPKAEVAREPTRPETVRSPGWTDRGDMESQQRSALEYAKVANQRIQEHRAETQQNAGSARTNLEAHLAKTQTGPTERGAPARDELEKHLKGVDRGQGPKQEPSIGRKPGIDRDI